MRRRASSSSPLSIWANGELVGYWPPASHRPMELRYEESWLRSKMPARFPCPYLYRL